MNNGRNGAKQVKLEARGVLLDGRAEVLLCGSLFYFRLPRAVWRDRAEKLVRAGYNCVDVYFPWNYHEREDGSFDFTGERDVRAFLETLQAAGLYVVARPGPYICSEWNGGGIPARVLESGAPIRCADEAFLSEAEKWYRAILPVISPYTYDKGGNIILLQLENELDFFDCPAPRAYIARLLSLAREYVREIPCFCCAGQYDAEGAGGFTDGVEATLNCYPDSLDNTFDGELQAYAYRFAKLGKPLLVSETNRDHFLLRRELSCGAKLLGAYNQAAGVNFDYQQAINNWGSPDSLIATVYDFWSMIDAAGGYRPEAEEGALFGAFLRTAGEALAAAVPAGSVQPDYCEFTTTDGGLRVLSLAGDGAAVCAPNFSDKAGKISVSYAGRTVTAEVLPQRAPFFLFDLDLRSCGIPARLTRANCEPVYASETELVFHAEGQGEIGLDFGSGEELVTSEKTLHGVRIRFLKKAEALAAVSAEVPVPAVYRGETLMEISAAPLPEKRELSPEKGTYFTALGIREGLAEYSVRVPEGKGLYLEGPCDFLRVSADGAPAETVYADGRDRYYEPCGTGAWEVCAEKWGHSNFDDPQSPSLRAASRKGVLSFSAATREKIGRCDFRLLDTFGEKTVSLSEGFPVRLGVEKWNSTRKPVVCSYTFPVKRGKERIVLHTTENTDVAVYLEGKLLGMCDFGKFEITKYLKENEEKRLTLVYRKKVWTQNCGEAVLYRLTPASVLHVRAVTGKEVGAVRAEGEKLSLPLSVETECGLVLTVKTQKEGFIRLQGENLSLTCAAGGRVVGRLQLGWKNTPAVNGGEANELYWNPVWGEKLYLYARPLCSKARLTGAELVTAL